MPLSLESSRFATDVMCTHMPTMDWKWSGENVELEGREPSINTPLHLSWHSKRHWWDRIVQTLRSVGGEWEDMIVPGWEDPGNWVNPPNLSNSKRAQKLWEIVCAIHWMIRQWDELVSINTEVSQLCTCHCLGDLCPDCICLPTSCPIHHPHAWISVLLVSISCMPSWDVAVVINGLSRRNSSLAHSSAKCILVTASFQECLRGCVV